MVGGGAVDFGSGDALMITLERRFVRNDSLLATEVDGALVMMDVDSGKYFHLDPVGAKIWAMIDRPTAVSDVCDRLLGAYDGELGQIQVDVLAYFARLEAADLVRRA